MKNSTSPRGAQKLCSYINSRKIIASFAMEKWYKLDFWSSSMRHLFHKAQPLLVTNAAFWMNINSGLFPEAGKPNHRNHLHSTVSRCVGAQQLLSTVHIHGQLHAGELSTELLQLLGHGLNGDCKAFDGLQEAHRIEAETSVTSPIPISLIYHSHLNFLNLHLLCVSSFQRHGPNRGS